RNQRIRPLLRLGEDEGHVKRGGCSTSIENAIPNCDRTMVLENRQLLGCLLDKAAAANIACPTLLVATERRAGALGLAVDCGEAAERTAPNLPFRTGMRPSAPRSATNTL